jgi:uncharacterized coiled-coil DUF342 family protein
MALTWEQSKAKAQGILGKDGKIPDPKANLTKFVNDWLKLDKEYHAAVDVLQAKILAMQNGNSTYKNAIKQYQDQITRTDFGLDAKNADDQKKITAAQDALDAFLDERMGTLDENVKNLDELDKHSMAISRYQSPT